MRRLLSHPLWMVSAGKSENGTLRCDHVHLFVSSLLMDFQFHRYVYQQLHLNIVFCGGMFENPTTCSVRNCVIKRETHWDRWWTLMTAWINSKTTFKHCDNGINRDLHKPFPFINWDDTPSKKSAVAKAGALCQRSNGQHEIFHEETARRYRPTCRLRLNLK